MLEHLDPARVCAAHLVSTQLDAEDLLEMIGSAFGIDTRGLAKADVLLALEKLFSSTHCQGRRCLLVLDEAQNLTPRAVEELRMLSNFQFGKESLLQSFLIGQTEFRQVLQSPQMMQFRQRVIAACHIAPLDVEDTQGYIEHRLRCAGSAGLPHIEAAAFVAIFKASGGVPRKINTLCDRLLLAGYLAGKTCFAESDVDQVVRELEAETALVNDAGAKFTRAEVAPATAPATPAGAGNEPAATLASLNVEQFGERLRRLEYSLLQLEKISSVSLELLQRLLEEGRSGARQPIPPPSG